MSRTHLQSQTPLYKVWISMWSRCRNPKRDFWYRYGGRGIKVCDRWKSFEAFAEDMRSGYRHGLTIERIDNDGDYSPDNCKWATQLEQAQNTCCNKYLEARGKKQTLPQWAREIGVSKYTLYDRVRRGFSEDKVLATEDHRKYFNPSRNKFGRFTPCTQ